MSLKSQTNRKLSSIKSISIPNNLKKDMSVLVFLNQLINNIFEIYKILTDNIEFIMITEDYILTDNKRVLVNADNITITLPELPQDYQEITIKSLVATDVIINSSLIEIEDSVDYTITNKYDFIKLVYIQSLNKWILL